MLSSLYEAIPPWLVALALCVAAVSFVVAYGVQARQRAIEYKPALALGVAAVLLALAGAYVWLTVAPGASLAERGAVIRLLLLLLSGGVTHYNAGALRLIWRERRRRRRDRRDG